MLLALLFFFCRYHHHESEEKILAAKQKKSEKDADLESGGEVRGIVRAPVDVLDEKSVHRRKKSVRWHDEDSDDNEGG